MRPYRICFTKVTQGIMYPKVEFEYREVKAENPNAALALCTDVPPGFKFHWIESNTDKDKLERERLNNDWLAIEAKILLSGAFPEAFQWAPLPDSYKRPGTKCFCSSCMENYPDRA